MFLREEMEYEKYPDPDLALMMDQVKIKKTKCAACDNRQKFVIPVLCEQHYAMWIENRRRFEKLYYNGLELK